MDSASREARITRMVERFYDIGKQDPVLSPVFEAAIDDWDGHVKIVADFWSNALYATGRYKVSPFGPHMKLDFPVQAFDNWMTCFTQAVQEVLTEKEAQIALARARHMTEAFKVGIFPFTLPDGTPSKFPAKFPAKKA